MIRSACDLLILGGGGAGLFAAYEAARRAPGLAIVVAVKGLAGKCGCTRMVQGGYNAVLHPDDSPDRHLRDTLRGGMAINDQELAAILVADAPARICDLEVRMGCYFDRNADGSVHQKPFAGQSFDRTVHRKDLTGIEIVNQLRNSLFAMPQVRFLEETRGIDLLLDGDGRATGCLLLDARSGESTTMESRAVVLATGGGATLFMNAAPALEKTADGMAMAWRAGARMVDMEMMQFHPTGLVAPGLMLHGAVLEEGLRGAGAIMLNAGGERFMHRYDPERMERSTRDRVARASFMEIQAGRGSPRGGVWIDATGLGRDTVRRMFPGMVERCRDVGCDLSTEPVEVCPSGHYHMGGVKIDRDCQSSIPGLFACGEDAGGVHGANRLGGNGVGDAVVFGARAGAAAVAYCLEAGGPRTGAAADERARAFHDALPSPGTRGGTNPFHLHGELKRLMWSKAGLVRDADGLKAAQRELDEIADRTADCSIPGESVYNLAWQEALNVANATAIARLIVHAAMLRTESRGSHYRADHPQTDNDRWLRNIVLENRDGRITDTFQDVRFTRMSREEALGLAAGTGEEGAA
jgi:succinate dehydrogenase/fumarate reductase flavoprotein subunit